MAHAKASAGAFFIALDNTRGIDLVARALGGSVRRAFPYVDALETVAFSHLLIFRFFHRSGIRKCGTDPVMTPSLSRNRACIGDFPNWTGPTELPHSL
jgi:hypothetical protein